MTKNDIRLFNELQEARYDYEIEKKNSIEYLAAVGLLEYCENKYKSAYKNYCNEQNKTIIN